MTAKTRLSATVDTDVLAAVQAAVAAGEAESVSAYVNDALRLKAEHDRRLRGIDDFTAAYEAEHGEITDEQMEAAYRRAGQLLARTGTSDAIDASVICLAQDGDDVLTSDPADLQALARAAGVHVDLISVLAPTRASKVQGARRQLRDGPLAVGS